LSPLLSKGLLNHCEKSSDELNMVGNKKFRSAHNSSRLFYNNNRTFEKVKAESSTVHVLVRSYDRHRHIKDVVHIPGKQGKILCILYPENIVYNSRKH
jgi:hypothetical protein